MNKIKLLLVAALILVLSACGGDKPLGNNYEEAYMNLLAKKKQLNSQGVLAEVATFASRDLQTGINKVELETRAMLTRSLETKTSSLQKSFREEAGEEFLEHFTTATKSISSRVLTGTTLSEVPFFKEDNGKYRVVGLMIMDPKVFAEALAAEAEANEAMKVRFHASKAYKNLNDEVAAYENFKKSNTPVK
jgi:hypothetical protein